MVGIGLNAAVRLSDLPPALRAGAATLGQSPRELEATLKRLLAALARRLDEPAQQTLAAWRARDALRDREIAWGQTDAEGLHRGRAEGIDGDGRLVVALRDGGHVALQSGEVHLREDA